MSAPCRENSFRAPKCSGRALLRIRKVHFERLATNSGIEAGDEKGQLLSVGNRHSLLAGRIDRNLTDPGLLSARPIESPGELSPAKAQMAERLGLGLRKLRLRAG